MRDQGSVRTAVVGVGGYAGAELARLLLAHPLLRATPPVFFARAAQSASGGSSAGRSMPLEALLPQLGLGSGCKQPEVVAFSWDVVAEAKLDIVFLALPHQASRDAAPEWLKRGVRVIDLSGAWRLHDAQHRAVYGFKDSDAPTAAATQASAVYGCPELHRDRLLGARLVANPGCYATSIILALAPLLRAGLIDLDHGIICDAKSGVSGAGKTPNPTTHFMHAADNLSAYGVFGHRHLGEMLEQLGVGEDQIQFTPHLLPVPRGILSTIYVRLSSRSTADAIEACLRGFYAESPLVRIRAAGDLPEIQHVVRTSYCDIGFALAPDGRRLVLVSCLDNLLKGAASQAIQNMNLMCGWAEAEGLL